ncbi:14432_t:CDS:2, partial [Racocetra persica]
IIFIDGESHLRVVMFTCGANFCALKCTKRKWDCIHIFSVIVESQNVRDAHSNVSQCPSYKTLIEAQFLKNLKRPFLNA